jgi:photosystem II stability/assembly factor-like uncharacterized protein
MRSFSKFLLIFFLAALAPAQRRMGRDQDGAFRFRFVGPMVGNRVAAVAGVPGDASTYYAGAASGGIFKSTDGGNNWTPIFDKESATAIGALAVAPSDRNVVWAGTGEAWVIRDSDVMGNGIYKSTDAGKTWTRMGLDETGRIGRIIVNPTNPDIVFACAVGRATGPQQERGVFRTLDGGAHWDRVLFADQNTGCSGLSLDPHNPRVLFAGMWQLEMHSWGEFSGGPGSGIYVSRDGGTKWTRIEAHGLPKSPVGKIDVAVAPTNSNRVYALIQTKDQGSLWRSDDGGENWKVVNWDRALIGRAGYYIRLAVSPASDNEVLVSNSSFHQSLDGGETFHSVPWGGDNHDIWIDPTNADRFMISDDAGLTITTVHGRGSHRVQLPIGQMYHVAVDNQVPYYVYGNMQDNSTMRGPSISPPGAGYGRPQEYGWEHRLGGCESGFTLPDYTDPNIVWASCYGDEVTRWDGRTKLARSVSPWLHTLDSPPNATKYRCHWTAPLAIDPFDHNTVYFGCQVIFQTSNGGSSWSVISPDLSTQDPTRNGPSGGIVGDNLGQFYGEVVFAIAPSPVEKGLIWAGTNDGLVWIKRASGEWTNVSKNIAGLPAWGSVTNISPSTFDAGTAYVSVDFHLNDNRDPFIYKTNDFGKTWTKISDGIPKHQLSYVRCVIEDPNQKGLLFAGTGNALYYSLDDGAKWTALQEGLPHAPVSWVTVQKQFHDLVISTYGRGFYILDDITPLEQMAKEPTSTSVRFFPPRPAYRFLSGQRAYLDFALKAKPKDEVKIAILDADGKIVNESWDLHYAKFKLVELRTTPPENPHIWNEPRFRDADSRPITHWGAEEAEVGPIAAPGKYTARLTVDGETYAQPLEILPDPSSTADQQQIEAAVRLQLRIRDDINVTSDMVNRIEWMRKQLDDVQKMQKSPQGKADLLARAQEMDQKLQNVEYKLITRSLALSDDKYFVEAYNVYFNLIWLNGEVGTGGGDVAGGADYGPTETSRVLLDNIEKDLNTAKTEYADLMDKQVPAFNQWLGENGMVPLAGK